jgi:hypothetical protein
MASQAQKIRLKQGGFSLQKNIGFLLKHIF